MSVKYCANLSLFKTFRLKLKTFTWIFSLISLFVCLQAWANPNSEISKQNKFVALADTEFLDQEFKLPIPKALHGDVQFWIDVFTKADTSSGYLHDAKYLDVVYGKIQFPKGATPRQRNKLVKQHKKRIERIIRTLAQGKSSKDLDAEETRIKNLLDKHLQVNTYRQAIPRLRFQLGQADKFKAGIVRSGRWMQHFEAMMEKHKVPLPLSLLPHVESSFVPYARSNVGAAGMWQFTRGTGRQYMQVGYVVDERLDPYIAAEAAAKLLKHNYSKVRSWPLAITAYNHGLRSVTRAANKFGKDNLVKILREYDGRRFGFASRNFYVSFAAAVYAHQNYEKYFGPLEIEPYQAPDVYPLPNYLSVAALEKDFDVNTLKKLNPALSSSVWRGEKFLPPNYPLRLPKGSQLKIDQIAGEFWYGEQTPDLYHRVKRGETLSEIATRYKIRLSELKKANNIVNVRRIQIGQRLVLPGRPNKTLKRPIIRIQKDGIYTVQRGDTIGEIAKSFEVNQTDLIAWNQINDVKKLVVGQELRFSPDPELENVNAATAFVTSLSAEDKAAALLANETVNEPALAPELPEALSTEKIIDKPEVITVAALQTIADEYQVNANNSVTVLGNETIGHYADWLNTSASDLRRLNNIPFRKAIHSGERFLLDFSYASEQEFLQKRLNYHQEIEKAFFNKYKIEGETEVEIQTGDSLWQLAQQEYQVPLWLLKKYNPNIEIEKLSVGSKVVFPLVVEQ